MNKMKVMPSSREMQRSSGLVGSRDWQTIEAEVGVDESGSEDELPNAAQHASSSDGLFLDNVAYGLKARLAFSPYLKGATMDAVIPYADPEPQGSAVPEPLAAARAVLQRTVLQRLRELQLLTEWPLLRPRSTAVQMERLLAGGTRPSELVGVRSGPPLDFPRLPGPLQGLCLVGPMDLAIALALAGAAGGGAGASCGTAGSGSGSGTSSSTTALQQQLQVQIGKDWMTLSQTGRGSIGAGGLAWAASLPLGLGQLPGLPAAAALPWPAPSLAWLREFFRDLNPQQRHVGVDDLLLPWFRDVKVAAARALAAEGGVRAAAGFAVFGVPPGVRAAVWETAMGLRRPLAAGAAALGPWGHGGAGAPAAAAAAGGGTLDSEDLARFEKLCTQALEQPLLLDLLVAEDAGPLVGNSEAFFLFEESVRAMLLAFLRDGQVANRLAAPPLALLQATNAVHAVLAPMPPQSPRRVEAPAAGQPPGSPGGAGADGAGGAAGSSQSYYPPSGVLPYRGLSLLAAPLCYMYEDPAASYLMFRAMYCRYWSKLHSLSCCGLPSPALPGLLKVFEALMQELDPQLVAHLSHLGLLAPCLVLPWITTAFAGALPVQEVLLLWDRILGLDSLLPLPLLAAAVMCFRRHVLLSCTSPAEAVAALSDVTQLRVVPLLQAVLFPGPGPEG